MEIEKDPFEGITPHPIDDTSTDDGGYFLYNVLEPEFNIESCFRSTEGPVHGSVIDGSGNVSEPRQLKIVKLVREGKASFNMEGHSKKTNLPQLLQRLGYSSQTQKPPFSPEALITMALTSSSSGHLTLPEINKFIIDTFVYYRTTSGWENSIGLCLREGNFKVSQCNCSQTVESISKTCYMSDNDLWAVEYHTSLVILQDAFEAKTKTGSPMRKSKPEAIKTKSARFSGSLKVDEKQCHFKEKNEQTYSALQMNTPSVLEANKNTDSCYKSHPELRKLFRKLAEAPECLATETRPPLSYPVLITLALISSNRSFLRTGEIVNTVAQMFPYFRNKDKVLWRASVLKTLNRQNNMFVKIPGESFISRECYWSLKFDISSVIKMLTEANTKLRTYNSNKVNAHLHFDAIEQKIRKKSNENKKRLKNNKLPKPLIRTNLEEIRINDDSKIWESNDVLLSCSSDSPLEEKCKETVTCSTETMDKIRSYKTETSLETMDKEELKDFKTTSEIDLSPDILEQDFKEELERSHSLSSDELVKMIAAAITSAAEGFVTVEAIEHYIAQHSGFNINPEEVLKQHKDIFIHFPGSRDKESIRDGFWTLHPRSAARFVAEASCQPLNHPEDPIDIDVQTTRPSVSELLFPVVRLERHAELDRLALSNKERKVSLSESHAFEEDHTTEKFGGWHEVDPKLLDTIDAIRQLIEENQKSDVVTTSTMQKDSFIVEANSGFLGFDLGHCGKFRGWEKVHTRHRDHIFQIVRELEGSMDLVQALRECEQAARMSVQEFEEHPNEAQMAKTKKRKMSEPKESQEDLTSLLKDHFNNLTNDSGNSTAQPVYSNTLLILLALVSTNKLSLPLKDIYQFIQDTFPFYRLSGESWKPTVETTLKLNNLFTKACSNACRTLQDHGGCWKVELCNAEEILGRACKAKKIKAIEDGHGNEAQDVKLVNNKKPKISETKDNKDSTSTVKVVEKCQGNNANNPQMVTNSNISETEHSQGNSSIKQPLMATENAQWDKGNDVQLVNNPKHKISESQDDWDSTPSVKATENCQGNGTNDVQLVNNNKPKISETKDSEDSIPTVKARDNCQGDEANGVQLVNSPTRKNSETNGVEDSTPALKVVEKLQENNANDLQMVNNSDISDTEHNQRGSTDEHPPMASLKHQLCNTNEQMAGNNKDNLIEKEDDHDSFHKILQRLLQDLTRNAALSTKEPEFSNTVLIVLALVSTSQRALPLENIYQFIQDTFPYYRFSSGSWKSSVYATLKKSDVFDKACCCTCRKLDHQEGCWAVKEYIAEKILSKARIDQWISKSEKKLRYIKNNGHTISFENKISNEKQEEKSDQNTGPVKYLTTTGVPPHSEQDQIEVVTLDDDSQEQCEHSADQSTSQEIIEIIDLDNNSQEPCGSFKCTKCKKEFSCQSVYSSHLNTHLKDKWPCYLCHLTFPSEQLCQTHVTDKHPGEENRHMSFTCEMCASVFSVQRLLDLHMETIHINSCKLKCDFCEPRAYFFSQESLKRHLLSKHSEMYPTRFECNMCNACFDQWEKLALHLKISHAVK